MELKNINFNRLCRLYVEWSIHVPYPAPLKTMSGFLRIACNFVIVFNQKKEVYFMIYPIPEEKIITPKNESEEQFFVL